MRFEDKVVVITGASPGIDEGVAKKFLDEGALVVGCDIEPEIHIESSRVIYIQTNLTEFAQAQHVVEEAMKAFNRMSELVCYAGVTSVGPLETMDCDTFMREFSISMGGVSDMYKTTISELERQEGFIIVDVESDLGVCPIPERVGYYPSEAGVTMLAKCIALEYAPSICMNAILPGLTHIPMVEQRFTEAKGPKAPEESYANLCPLHKVGKIEDMANVIAFLSSDESGSITGEIMQVCSGGPI